ncbi:MAG TPA: hypothetical protein VEL05_10760, partial [Candidatus Acidoferrum sp.]|nr:hypothetical protein [Candidatus Acidoferrum sp.]
MNVRSSSLVLACAVLLSASPSRAQGQPSGNKKKALELYEKGSVQYDLRHWTQAVDLWMQAYEAYNAPEFLFNIAQAHRHEGNCEQALFFYRRYLATKPNARNRAEVENFIKELEDTCKSEPPPTGSPGGGTTGDGGTAARTAGANGG